MTKPKVLTDVEITHVSLMENPIDPNCVITHVPPDKKKQVLIYLPSKLHAKIQHAVIDSSYKNVSQWLEAAAREKLSKKSGDKS